MSKVEVHLRRVARGVGESVNECVDVDGAKGRSKLPRKAVSGQSDTIKKKCKIWFKSAYALTRKHTPRGDRARIRNSGSQSAQI